MTDQNASPPPTGPAGGETILLVEDEEIIRLMLVEVMTLQGYFVLEASMAEVALSLSEDFDKPIQLLITDMTMPGMNGWDLAKCLRTTRPGIPILFVSGHNDHETSRWGKMEKPVEYLHKPFSLEAFLDKVREMLDRDKINLRPEKPLEQTSAAVPPVCP